jgi:hypothetical protein
MGGSTSRVATAQPAFVIANQVGLHSKGKVAEGIEFGVVGAERVEDKAIKSLPFCGITIE